MLQPSRTKYRRPHGLSYEGVATKGNTVAFGEYGLAALEGTYITLHRPFWQGLDQNLPTPRLHQEASRSPYGFR